MKFCVLMGSPREEGNTAALLAPFLEECGALGSQTQVIPLYDRAVNPCLGCMARMITSQSAIAWKIAAKSSSWTQPGPSGAS